MKRNQVKKQVYMRPQCKMFMMETEMFICVSVRPNSSDSNQQGYQDKGEHNVGTILFGDPSTMAPSKGSFWDEEEEEDLN